jgi:hypothetical protein
MDRRCPICGSLPASAPRWCQLCALVKAAIRLAGGPKL